MLLFFLLLFPWFSKDDCMSSFTLSCDLLVFCGVFFKKEGGVIVAKADQTVPNNIKIFFSWFSSLFCWGTRVGGHFQVDFIFLFYDSRL